jgi:DNA-binding response OmpR family regulator
MNILVVEDEDAIREAEVAYIRRAGYSTIEACDGERALVLSRQNTIHLAIIDVNIPSLDGLEVCRRIRQLSTMPIIMVTAKDGDNDELRGLEVGADDYIKKPFNPNILMARVQNLLRRHGNGSVKIGSLIIDPGTMIVTKDGNALTLTTTQFNMLFALISRPGIVLTRDQLIDIVYSDPFGHAIYDRTIDAHIKSIRKLIEDDPAHPLYIQTVIGSGYRFRGDM